MGHLVSMVNVGLRYERIWRAAVGLLATIGVLTALVFISPATNLAAFLVAALTMGAVCLSIGLGRDLPNADLLRVVPRGAVLGGLCVLAVCGYAAAVGARTVALLLLVVGVSPPVVDWLRSGRPPRPVRPVRPAHPLRRSSLHRARRTVKKKLPKAPVLQQDLPMPKYLTAVVRSVCELSDEELCLAWRRSFTQLQRTAGADRRQAMIDVRRAYLDELERRHPDSFAAWLASNPRAAGDPAKFFTHRADH
ncbi:hypothetical protein [Kribbella jejuensis]|uniref:Uncharacterized protein n=1 Tax=Kribbella jejuensis TaxID=236068 RepID=A0A542E9S8_9ACTN|nr:hypothetical protein [Kribbella jejuensis]TQJ12081.1 hypothetical protein FB475_5009 [Kribbella jejuensis]